jgi:thioredoxin-like negative regulator of GroEL
VLALERGQVRYTYEVSRALVALNDGARLDEVFSRILDVAPVGANYLALVDYADGLARLGRREADARFEEAIQLYPVNNSEAIGRYAQHLLDRGDAEKAVTVLEQMTPEMRQMNGSPVFLYKRILERLGRDTSFADAEIELMRQRLGTHVVGGVPGPELTGAPATPPQRPKP